MKKRLIIELLIGLLVLVGAATLSGVLTSMKEEPEIRKPAEAKKYVETRKVDYQDIETKINVYGRVQTGHSLDLLSEVSGRILSGRTRLKPGQSFKKGTLLFYIDPTEASLNLKSQKSNFLRDLAAILPDLKIDYPDNYPVWESYFNELDINEKLPALPSKISEKEKTFMATKGIFSSFYSIKSAEARLAKHWYYAPFDGSISEIVLETGAFVNPGNRIGTILRSGDHELKVSIETRDIPWIHEGAPSKIISTESHQSWDGEIARISDHVNQNTQSVDVYLRIFPGQSKIYDGQFMQASIPAMTIKNGMQIPRNIMYNGNEVFILQDTLLKKKTVDIYRLMEENAIIGGLEPGSDLVVEPLVNAHNDMKAYKLEQKDIDLEKKKSSEGKDISEAPGSQKSKVASTK